MELKHLIEACSRPDAYPVPPRRVEVRQTHISVVFLAGDLVWKVKKPVRLEFLDYSTLAKRRHYSEEEVRLNRRLAPDVYLGVVPITQNPDGVRVGGDGEVVEWAVQMRRLPDEATLAARLARDEVPAATAEELARRVAAFHRRADGGPHIAAFGRFDVVAANARENLVQAERRVGVTLSAAVLDRLRARTEQALTHLRPLVEARAERGVPRDTHGDLRLEHLYLFPERPPPGDVVIVDCIEFNERFRFADPVADMAFLAMDLAAQGRRDLAAAFVEEYLRASGDEEGRALVPFYTAYRSAVRAKVRAIVLDEPEVPPPQRDAALEKARGHWLLALGELEEPGRRPCLVLVGGLPGSGKSTLSRGLAERAGFEWVRSDVVRKELAGVSGSSGRAGGEIYSPEWTERTYRACLERAGRLLFEGGRVVVDATFREERRRRDFMEMAARWSVPALFFACQSSPKIVRERLLKRRGDVSDADWSVYQEMATSWEVPGPSTARVQRIVDTGGGREEALRQALAVLHDERLA